MIDIQPNSVADDLFKAGYDFDFFQAVRLLERLQPAAKPVGLAVPPVEEIVRFRALASLAFPPSQIYEVLPSEPAVLQPTMTVTFFGLTGPSGILPRHYTEMLLRLRREGKGVERTTLRDWFDLFNHRLIAFFFRAWQKYRFWTYHERGDALREEADPVSQALYCLAGLGTGGLRRRLRIATWDSRRDKPEQTLERVHDLALAYYAGLLAQRRRSAVGLEAVLGDYFQLPLEVVQFQGEWLQLERGNQTRLGEGNSQLGVDALAGERVWDVQGKFRLRLGPLSGSQFLAFLPDRSPSPERKSFFMLLHLVRLYVGSEFAFDVQLILRAEEVPECQLGGEAEPGPRLGWNTWAVSQPCQRDVADAVFAGEERVWLNPDERALALRDS